MAFNWQTFRTRTITSIIFLAVMLSGLLWSQWSFFILFSIIHFGCWREYQKLVMLKDPGYKEITAFHQYGVMLAGWSIMLYFTNDTYDLFGFKLHELGWWTGLIAVFLLPIAEILFTKNIQLKNIGYSLFGLIYISLSFGLMMDIYNTTGIRTENIIYTTTAAFIPLTLIAALWTNDTMAYLIGSLIGKHPVTKISPKKTWEGTAGGIIFCIALMYFFWGRLAYSIHDDSINMIIGIIATVAAISGVFGDLLESKLKRMAGIKDSGTLLPGHGGFLDRFDSLLLAIPFVWLYVTLVMK